MGRVVNQEGPDLLLLLVLLALELGILLITSSPSSSSYKRDGGVGFVILDFFALGLLGDFSLVVPLANHDGPVLGWELLGMLPSTSLSSSSSSRDM